ncbi:hypothetical protein SLOPH_230 [Spraguea lophii 42_110]|uniref:Ubiquitin-like domain-containing protein n=1 Tax=Spraguea lophii (strain 42_110) TaxID=1358809 RepID=S7W8X6_SPRLO|nr:hypothetical protein SLOPH_230 [Spraguea lophii 42_110]
MFLFFIYHLFVSLLFFNCFFYLTLKMHIKLRTTVKTFEVEIENDATIGDLKKKLEEQMDESERIAAKDQKFILLGKILKDEMKVSEIDLSKGSAIFVAGTKPKAPEEKKSENIQATKPPQSQNSFPQQPYQAYNGSLQIWDIQDLEDIKGLWEI